MALSMIELVRTDFRTTKSADEINTRFQNILGLQHRYGPARLAIGRSLAVPTPPDPTPVQDEDPGKAIKGENMFGVGPDLATWLALIVEHSGLPDPSRKDLQGLVGAHWHRGANLLWEEWKGCGMDYDKFLLSIMERAGLQAGDGDLTRLIPGTGGSGGMNPIAVPVELYIGDPSTDVNTDEKISWRINGRGNSPHIAVMGTLGTGKTRTAMQMLRRAKDLGKPAVIVFDMGKGDLAADAGLVKALGATVIHVPKEILPLDVMSVSERSETAINDASLRFRESFAGVSRSRPGGAQLDALREAAGRAFRKKGAVALTDVRDALKTIYTERKRKDDGVIATFNDLCMYDLFSPTLTPEEFFSKSWIIDVHDAPDTVQRLVVFLILDALDAHFARLKDSAIDAEGNRALRLIVAIDEARKVLGYNQPSLVNIIRTCRSKGGAVMFISQSPDDFAQEEEDFLENIGLPICFRTNAKSANLKVVLGETVDLAGLPNGVCVTRLPDRRGITRVRAWEE